MTVNLPAGVNGVECMTTVHGASDTRIQNFVFSVKHEMQEMALQGGLHMDV